MANAGRVIGKVLRGNGVAGLLRYLFGPGRAHEHTDPHVVARWDDETTLLPAEARPDQSGRRRLARLLDQPLAALPRQPKETVWHCSLRAAPSDRQLTDEQWTEVAREVLHRTGLAPRGIDTGCRWVAVRHADDHIHLVVTLARQDGRAPRTSNDFYRVGEACRWAEQTYGLQETAPRDRTAAKRATRGESEKAPRLSRPEPPRTTLQRTVRRAAAASAATSAFLANLRRAGVLVRERRSTLEPNQITGYAVALPGDRTADGAPIWFSGGRLAPDLTLPSLQRRWEGQPDTQPPTPPPSRLAVWDLAARTATAATLEIRRLAPHSPGAASDVAHAASDALSVLAHVVEGRRGGPLTQAADAFDRASRESWSRTAAPRAAASHLRRTARLLHQLGRTNDSDSAAVMTLVAELIRLVEEVARLRDQQQRAAQASAARRALERLDDANPAQPASHFPARRRDRTSHRHEGARR